MTLSLTTRWNANRHESGEGMIEEILKLGFSHVELGYDLTADLVPGIRKMVEQKAVTVDSLHNFCPVPVSAPNPHPELFLLSSLDRREVEMAVSNIGRTIEFASDLGAKCIVVHAGRVDMKMMTVDLIDLSREGRQYDEKYDKLKLKLLMERDRKVAKHLESLYRGIELLLPALEKANVTMGFENLPYWEAVPCESEMEEVHKRFPSPFIRYWHDMGHGQVRENLGFIGHRRWMERLSPITAGMHIHDVLPPASDHLMPSKGKINFAAFKNFLRPEFVLVLEPGPNAAEQDIIDGVRTITEAWGVSVSDGGNSR